MLKARWIPSIQSWLALAFGLFALASQRPGIQPIDPAVQATAGSKARLALVIS